MSCQKCNSTRILNFDGKCDDRFACNIGDAEVAADYVPRDIGIGGGDNIYGRVCLDCGQMQGNWPLPLAEMEQSVDE